MKQLKPVVFYLIGLATTMPESATAGDWGPVYLSAVPGTAQAGGELLTFDLPAPSEARQAGDPVNPPARH